MPVSALKKVMTHLQERKYMPVTATFNDEKATQHCAQVEFNIEENVRVLRVGQKQLWILV
jgi:hypothetical protein